MSIQPFIKCSDIKTSLPFYTKLLDFQVIQAPDPDPDAFMSMYAYLKREESFLHLSQHAGDGVFGTVIYIEVNNIDDIYNKFLHNGLKVQEKSGIAMEPVQQTWGMKEFYVADPDGNRIRFGQRMAQSFQLSQPEGHHSLPLLQRLHIFLPRDKPHD